MATVTLAHPLGRFSRGALEDAPLLTPVMDKFVIEGGAPLSGTVTPAGNKNAALPLLTCCLLTDEEVVLHNVPRIRDVEAMVDLLRDIGVRADWRSEHTICLHAQ